MGDRPVGDDGEVRPEPGEMTVPPWLRTGPTPETGPSQRSGSDGSDAADAPPRTRGPGREATPTRITLGARTPEPAPAAETPERDDLSTLPLRAPDPAHRSTDQPGRDPGTAPGPSRPPASRHPAASAHAAGPHSAGPNSAGPHATDAPSVPPATPAGPAGRRADRDPRPSASPRARSAAAGPGWRRIALLAAAGAALLAGSAVLGYVLVDGASDPAATEAAAPATDCAPVEEAGRTVGDGPGDLGSPAGAVLAFDHAYYVERSAEKAFEAVAPSSRMSVDRLRTEGIDAVPEGTTHCVDARELSPTLLEVTLTENRPDSGPLQIRQRIRLEEAPDGSWGIVSITPAG